MLIWWWLQARKTTHLRTTVEEAMTDAKASYSSRRTGSVAGGTDRRNDPVMVVELDSM